MSKWRCNECGSANVETKIWTKLNEKGSDEKEGSDELGDNWCQDCETHGRLNKKED